MIAIKADVEADNSDVTMYFYGPSVIGYFLAQDLQYLSLSIFLVGMVLWIQTDSLWITFCGLSRSSSRFRSVCSSGESLVGD